MIWLYIILGIIYGAGLSLTALYQFVLVGLGDSTTTFTQFLAKSLGWPFYWTLVAIQLQKAKRQ